MDYEQKYKEALERAKKYKLKEDLIITQDIFPELKESEDERMWKLIKKYAHSNISDMVLNYDNITREQLESWIEKQGEQKPKFRIGDTIKKKSTGDIVTVSEVDLKNSEYRLSNTGFIPFKYEYLWELVEQEPAEWHREDEQNLNACLGYIPDEFLRKWLTDTIHAKYDKPADKVEPKFKVGDWIIFDESHNGVYQVERIDNYRYYLRHYLGGTMSVHFDNKLIRQWTIQDAKDGDVLVCPKYAGDIIPNIFIFKNINIKDNDVFCYCSFLETFRTQGYIANADPINTDFYPATKEQRDTLGRAMANAGYTFDFEKKELKKIV